VTPVIYSIDKVPPNIRWILYLNPLTVVVTGVRHVLLDGKPPDWGPLGIWYGVGLVCMVLSYAFFMRARRGFADVI